MTDRPFCWRELSTSEYRNGSIRNLANARSRHGGLTGAECIATLTLPRFELRRQMGRLLPITRMEGAAAACNG